jgi:hypothetical protein
MGRPLSFQVEGEWTLFELTFRCMQGRLLMRPGEECTKRTLGVIGRSLKIHGRGVKLLFGGGTSNHLHLIVATFDSVTRAEFKSHLKTNVSKELGDLFSWTEHLFGRRTRDIPILDEEALMGRVFYCLRHGHKEGLIAEDEQWPGVPWIDAVTRGVPLQGVWYNRTAFYRAKRRWLLRDKAKGVSEPKLQDFAETIEVPLEPLPCMKGLTEAQQQERWRELQREALRRYPQPEGHVLGAERVREQDPHTRPDKSSHSPAPSCHGSNAAVIEDWKSRYTQFVESYRDSWQKLRGELSRKASRLAFPSGGVPPTWPKPDLPSTDWRFPAFA